jgi:hypothetical protein
METGRVRGSRPFVFTYVESLWVNVVLDEAWWELNVERSERLNIDDLT